MTDCTALRNGEPTVSVLVLTFNGERFISEQLRSILAQTRPPDRVIICDDGSADGTLSQVRETLRSLSSPATEVVIDEHPHVGLRENLARGLTLCQSDFVALSDQDDIWKPSKLERLVPLLKKEEGVLAVFTDGDVVDAAGNVTGETLWRAVGTRQHERRRIRRGDLLQLLLKWNFVTGATMILRSSFLDWALPLPEQGLHDAWFAVLAAGMSGLKAYPEELISYRTHGANVAGVPPKNVRTALQQRRKRDPRAEEAVLFESASERLTARGAPPDIAARLAEKAAFTRRRAKLPEAFHRRLSFVGRSAIKGLYTRYCKRAIRSMTFDLFLGKG